MQMQHVVAAVMWQEAFVQAAADEYQAMHRTSMPDGYLQVTGNVPLHLIIPHIVEQAVCGKDDEIPLLQVDFINHGIFRCVILILAVDGGQLQRRVELVLHGLQPAQKVSTVGAAQHPTEQSKGR